MTSHAKARVSVLIAPRLNGDGFLAVVYRSQKIVTLPIDNFETALGVIAACLHSQFGFAMEASAGLARTAIDRYSMRVVATEETHVLADDLQGQLHDAQRVIVSLTEQLRLATRETVFEQAAAAENVEQIKSQKSG